MSRFVTTAVDRIRVATADSFTRSILILALVCVSLLAISFLQDIAIALGLTTWRRPMFDVDEEYNLYSGLSTANLLAAAALLGLIARETRRRALPRVAYWTALSAIFVYLAFDEAMVIHERLIPLGDAMMRDLFGLRFHVAWWLPVLPVLVLLAAAFLQFVLTLPARTRLFFIVCGAAYLCGSVGMEIVSDFVCAAPYGSTFACRIEMTTEESLEGLSIIVFLLGLGYHLRDLQPTPAPWMSRALSSIRRLALGSRLPPRRR